MAGRSIGLGRFGVRRLKDPPLPHAPSSRRVLAVAAVIALALHGVAGVVLMRTREFARQEPDVIMDVVLAPPWRPPPPQPAGHRPDQREPASVAVARGPATSRPAPAAAPSDPWRVRPSAEPEADRLRETLRARLGCDRRKLLGLTKAEVEACDAKLAEGAQSGPIYAVISPKLKKQFDGEVECPKDDEWCEYRIGKGPYPGLMRLGRKPRRPEWDQ